MLALAWANLTHHKLRTALSALAVGIGIMLMLVSRGLADGSLAEVNQRMQSVNAELVILPAQDNIIFTNGAPFRASHERRLQTLSDAHGPLATAVIPVFFGQVQMGGQQQRLFGVDPAQMPLFLASYRVVAGGLFDRASAFADRVRAGATAPASMSDPAYAAYIADGLELVIDERLQRVGNYQLGDQVQIMGQVFRIVGIIETGVAGRVFAPLQTLREIVVAGEPTASMYFVKLRPGLDAAATADRFQSEFAADVRVELKSEYGHLLRASFASVSLYLNASSGVALAACFLFILLTMYTMVIERTREIGILKSLGVTRLGLVRLSVHEALLISLGGVAIGLALAYGVRALLAVIKPLLTVDFGGDDWLIAVLVGVAGGTLSALYPGYRAARLDPAVALSRE
ncbi:MAG: ABC transporter permease [Phycisphaerae bacterium]|nr:ABC transporter permease [Phycisphaerae bacterium]